MDKFHMAPLLLTVAEDVRFGVVLICEWGAMLNGEQWSGFLLYSLVFSLNNCGMIR